MDEIAKNFWNPIDISVVPRPPVELLREQAAYLSEVSLGILKGKVDSDTWVFDSNTLQHRLLVHAPKIGDFTYEVLSVRHLIHMYPATVSSVAFQSEVDCQGYGELEAIVKATLQSDVVSWALAAMVRQSS